MRLSSNYCLGRLLRGCCGRVARVGYTREKPIEVAVEFFFARYLGSGDNSREHLGTHFTGICCLSSLRTRFNYASARLVGSIWPTRRDNPVEKTHGQTLRASHPADRIGGKASRRLETPPPRMCFWATQPRLVILTTI